MATQAFLFPRDILDYTSEKEKTWLINMVTKYIPNSDVKIDRDDDMLIFEIKRRDPFNFDEVVILIGSLIFGQGLYQDEWEGTFDEIDFHILPTIREITFSLEETEYITLPFGTTKKDILHQVSLHYPKGLLPELPKISEDKLEELSGSEEE